MLSRLLKRLGFAGASLVLFAASAQAEIAPSPPPANLRTDIIDFAVPRGWIAASYRTDGRNERAEFVPQGQSADSFTEATGFAATVVDGAVKPTNETAMDQAAQQLDGQCRVVAVRDIAPLLAQAGWSYLQSYCLDRTGGTPGEVEVTFKAIRVRGPVIFSVWRSWRGSPLELKALIRTRTGLRGDVVFQAKDGLDMDSATIDHVTGQLLNTFAADITRAEFCDLAQGERCSAWEKEPEPVPGFVAKVYISGAHDLTGEAALAEIESLHPGYTAKVQGDPRAFEGVDMQQQIALQSHSWTLDPGVALALRSPLLGAKMTGGSLLALDAGGLADPATRARMQAYIVYASRMTWALGVAPDRVMVFMPAAGKP